MEAAAIYEKLKGLFGGSVLELQEGNGDPFTVVERSRMADIARHLKEDQQFGFDSLVCLSAVDYADRYSVVYHLYSLKQRHRLTLKAYIPKDEPHIPSVQSVWRAANWHEREAFDLMGIRFESHPDMRRILLPEDWAGHPLRKDYVFPAEYDGIPCRRE